MARLSLVLDGTVLREWELTDEPLFIGRLPENGVQLDDRAASGRHAAIHGRNSEYMEELLEHTLEDLDSTNGTKVNDKLTTAPVRLYNGDLIEIGRSQFRYHDGSSEDLSRTDIILPDEE